MQVEQPPKQQIVDRIKKASNILVTVNRSPDVDLLAAAIGLTLMLEKLDKSAVAVFSGEIPRAIDFLKPDQVIEENVDSLRDFIIALDKDKADRLRYKVEGDVVRVYITPYKTVISEKDLKFSQGDFNVDLIVALGVEKSEDLDGALTAYGKILHDAQVITINTNTDHSSIGDVDWSEDGVSSYSEMIMSMSEALESGLLDQSIASALLTGLVSSTDRFRNEKTSSKVMTMAAQLMAAGANQQLIAEELAKGGDEPTVQSEPAPEPAPVAPADPSEINLRSLLAKTQPEPSEPEQPEQTEEPEPTPEPAPESIPDEAAEDSAPEPDFEIAQPDPGSSVIQDLAEETDRIADAQPAPDLSLPPLPGADADTKPSSWRDITPIKTDEEPTAVETAPDDDFQQPQEEPEISGLKERQPNKVILHHEGSTVAEAPSLIRSPINATFADGQEQPSVNTIGGGSTQPTAVAVPQFTQTSTPGMAFEMPPIPGDEPAVSAPEAEVTQPTMPIEQPVVPVFETPLTEQPAPDTPVVPEAPAQSALDSARATLSSLFGGDPAAPAPQPEQVVQPAQPTPDPYMIANPPAPQLPGLPMPDFSTLPPLPGELATHMPEQPAMAQPPQLGLPAAPAQAAAAPSADPAQFRLPGQ